MNASSVMFSLVNKLIPGYVNMKGRGFAWKKNAYAVRQGMREYGVPEHELFQPADLSEARDINAVVKSLAALYETVLPLWLLSSLSVQHYTFTGPAKYQFCTIILFMFYRIFYVMLFELFHS